MSTPLDRSASTSGPIGRTFILALPVRTVADAPSDGEQRATTVVRKRDAVPALPRYSASGLAVQLAAVALHYEHFSSLLPRVRGAAETGDSREHVFGVIRVEQVPDAAGPLAEGGQDEGPVRNALGPRGVTVTASWPGTPGATRMDGLRTTLMAESSTTARLGLEGLTDGRQQNDLLLPAVVLLVDGHLV